MTDESWIATDWSNGEDYTVQAIRRPGAKCVCVVPPELGLVTALEIRGSKVIARTESGISLIVPSGGIRSKPEY